MTYKPYRIFIYGFLLIALLFIQKRANAQKVYEGVLYPYNLYNINPAYTGTYEHLSILLNYRSASSKLEGMPEQLMFAIHSPVFKNMGLGLRVENYSEGLFNYLTSFIDYSYFVNINKNQILRFGISAGYSSNTIDQSNMIATDPSAIIEIAKQNFTGSKFISAAGIVYKHDNLEVSLASPILFATGKSFNSSFSASANYNFLLMNKQITLSPFIYTLYTKDLPLTFDIIVITDYKKLFQLGIGYRNRKAIILSTGITFSNFTFNYAADIGTSKLSNIYNLIHEISISYGIRKVKKEIKDSLYNPPLIVKNDSITEEKKISTDSTSILAGTNTNNKGSVNNPALNIQEKDIIVKADSTDKYSIEHDTLNNFADNQQEINITVSDSIDSENITLIKLAPGIYEFENPNENGELKKEQIDKAIAELKQQEKINSEKHVETEKNTNFLNQYYTIFMDIKKNAEIIDLNFDLIENFTISKDSTGKAYYTYGLFLTAEEANQTAQMLEKRGFEILEINKIGKN